MTTASLKVTYDLSEATQARLECRAKGGHKFPPGAEDAPGDYTCTHCGAHMAVREVRK